MSGEIGALEEPFSFLLFLPLLLFFLLWCQRVWNSEQEHDVVGSYEEVKKFGSFSVDTAAAADTGKEALRQDGGRGSVLPNWLQPLLRQDHLLMKSSSKTHSSCFTYPRRT